MSKEGIEAVRSRSAAPTAVHWRDVTLQTIHEGVLRRLCTHELRESDGPRLRGATILLLVFC